MRVDDTNTNGQTAGQVAGQAAGQTAGQVGGAAGSKLTGAVLARLAQAGAVQGTGETRKTEGSTTGEDRVRLSAVASNVGGEGSTREARIEQLQALVDAGKYQPELGAVADRIIEDALLEGRAETDRGEE
jgi:anti-sigma28 factor (negative regulator of flagellin synthesis)